MKKRTEIFLSISLALLVSSVAAAGDWTTWRGPTQNGVSGETNLIDNWSLDDGKNVVWTSEVGGRATPIVSRGKVYLNCRTNHPLVGPEKVHLRDQVICWDAVTGKELWRDEFNVFQTDIPAPRVGWAAMAADGETGNVYCHAVSGMFICYSADGERLWEYSLFEDFGKISGYGGRTQTPIIDEDRVIVSFMKMNWGDEKAPPPKQTYYAFDKKTGELIWKSVPGGKPYDTNYSAPMVAVIDGTRMLIGGNSDGGVHAIHARTGEKLWSFRMSFRGLNASAVVEGNNVFISHGEDNIDNSEFGRIQCIDGTGRGDITESHSVWRVDGVKAGYTGLVVKDGILYVVADTGKLYAYDSKTGEELWTHVLGTVGKGSPVWADGKLYVMEVNGNIHILKPSRTSCEQLSHVTLEATQAQGADEIYASPAISNGLIYFVTRDRTICVGKKTEPTDVADVAVAVPAEDAGDAKVALAHLIPAEVVLTPGKSATYRVRTYNAKGQTLETKDAEVSLGDGLTSPTVEGNKITGASTGATEAGYVTAMVDGVEAKGRLRAFAPLPWNFDFTGFAEKRVPTGWVSAFPKLIPTELDGNVAMQNTGGKGRPSNYIWLGPSTMKDYSMQADAMLIEDKFRLSSVGLTVNRYNLILNGNNASVSVQTWAPHLRMAKEVEFDVEPDVWYRLKLAVDVDEDGHAVVRGKVWPREDAEPDAWTIEAEDPHANTNGSPGLYLYSMAQVYYDNIMVTPAKDKE
jgi:outer membrane protein assembly factor BamB